MRHVRRVASVKYYMYSAATGGNGLGAYTDSNGLQLVRDEVAAYIEQRDGFPAIAEHISLTTVYCQCTAVYGRRTVGAQ